MAISLLTLMRSDMENGVFSIEKFLHQTTDVIPFLESWIKTQNHLSPATIKDYENSIYNHLIPWFKENKVMIHEIQFDVLCRLLNDINREGKGKKNVMYCLHTALKDAQKAGKIIILPPFPEKRRYKIEKKIIKSIPEERQIAIIKAIPVQHQPIFWWIKYHVRRPGEAIALHKVDYNNTTGKFSVSRSMSNKVLVNHTKTHKIHEVFMYEEFKPWAAKKHQCISPYYFTHETSRLEGQRYQHDFLVDLWNKAAHSCGESISMYAGLKHSSCTALYNDYGLSLEEIQIMTDHSSPESVLQYTDIKMQKKLQVQAKVLAISRSRQEQGKNIGENKP